MIKEDVMFSLYLAGIPVSVSLSYPLATRVSFHGEKHKEGKGRGFCLSHGHNGAINKC